LVEVAIAVVIVSIVVITTVGLLAPVQKNIEDVVSADEVSRLLRAVEIEMSVVRPSESASYKTGFDKAYQVVKNDNVVYAFFYRADVPQTPADLTGGRSTPTNGTVSSQRLGEDYVQQAAVFTEQSFAEAQSFFAAAEGRVFLVRFKLLESVMKPEAVDSFNAGGSDQFTEAVLPVAAEFYALESIDMVTDSEPTGFISSIRAGDIRPVFDLNMAFRR